MGGQFERRLHLLKQTLNEADVPVDVVEHWLAHTERLRAVVTRDPRGHCNDAPAPATKAGAERRGRPLPTRRKGE